LTVSLAGRAGAPSGGGVRDDWRFGPGRADPHREILDVESAAGHLLPAGGVFALAFLAAHRRELFPGQMFADLSKTDGWPSIPAEVIASVIVLQTPARTLDTAAA
jgi:hypothetical protein